MTRGPRGGPRRPPHFPAGKAGGDWFASLRGRTLMSIALVAVVASTRRTWFPSAQLAAMLVERGGCEFPIQLNARGALEGPWVNHSSHDPHALLDLAEFYSPARYQAMGKVVAAEEGEDDGKAPWGHVVEGLLTAGTLSTGNRLTLAFARLAERFLASWVRIDGISKGLGKAGMVKQIMFPAMAVNPKMQPCLAHVRIVLGRVYFRYGSFLEDTRKLKRINLAVKMILHAITAYDLRSLRAELFINACDKPVSFDNSLSSGCSGFPVFSTQWTPGSTDILFPDPLDLDYSPPQHAEHVPWAKTVSSAHGGPPAPPTSSFPTPSTSTIPLHNTQNIFPGPRPGDRYEDRRDRRDLKAAEQEQGEEEERGEEDEEEAGGSQRKSRSFLSSQEPSASPQDASPPSSASPSPRRPTREAGTRGDGKGGQVSGEGLGGALSEEWEEDEGMNSEERREAKRRRKEEKKARKEEKRRRKEEKRRRKEEKRAAKEARRGMGGEDRGSSEDEEERQQEGGVNGGERRDGEGRGKREREWEEGEGGGRERGGGGFVGSTEELRERALRSMQAKRAREG
ncbi:unnamed protein product [Closterium sp. NIES-54]